MVLTRKKIQRQNLEISGQNKKQQNYRFCIKKRNGKEFCLKVFQGRDLEMINICKHCPVIVITINYKSSLPFPQNRYDKCKCGKLFYNPHCSLLLGTLSINRSAKLVAIFFSILF